MQIYAIYFEYATFFLNFVRKFMRRLKKKLFLGLFAGTIVILGGVRRCYPQVVDPEETAVASLMDEQSSETLPAEQSDVADLEAEKTVQIQEAAPPVREQNPKHPFYRVPSFHSAFPDVQDVQIRAARKWGVKPPKNRKQAEERRSELVYVGANPYYVIDKGMSSSIPYLVPRASAFLNHIGRCYLDSLYMKGIPLHKIIVSSCLRTDDDVRKLRRHNGNAEEQSCHRFGTTVDICYNRYHTVSPPDGPKNRVVRDDTLKWVLSEVLRDAREEGRCYVKYEVKQGCFHITVR